MQVYNNSSVLMNKSVCNPISLSLSWFVSQSGSLSGSLRRLFGITLTQSSSLSGAHQLTRSLLGLQRRCRVAKVYPALL